MRPEMKLRRKKSGDSSDQQEPQKKKPKGLEAVKFEVSEDKAKLFLSPRVWVRSMRHGGS